MSKEKGLDKEIAFRYKFGNGIIKLLRKHLNLVDVRITHCDISCDNEDTTKVKLELEF